MRAYTVHCFCQPLDLLERPDPQPTGSEVVVEVLHSGVCHTDLHLQDGYYDMGGGKRLDLKDRGINPPLVLGHEILGRLVAKGPEAPAALGTIGQNYVVFPWLGCGQCDVCARGDENLCAKGAAIGIVRSGGYGERVVVPHARYLVDATGINPSLAATYACSGLTAYSALAKVEINPERDLLLLLGMGGVGLNGLLIARALGYRNIAAADIDPAKRELAQQHGATVVIDPSDAAAANAALAQFGGVAAAVDFVGASATAQFAVAALRKAGTYVAVGLFGGEVTLPLPGLVTRALTVRGSYVGNLAELNALLALVRAGKVAPLPVESVPFDQVNTALDRLRRGGVHGRLVLAR